MAKRKRIALIFSVNKNWMGGTYYVLNIINALNSLPEEDIPDILLLCQSVEDFEYAKNYTKYPRLESRIYRSSSSKRMLHKVINKISRFLFGRSFFVNLKLKENVDAVYPIINTCSISTNSHRIYWIPDFQEKFLPQLFQKKTIKLRDSNVRGIIQNEGHIIFSSQDALDSFRKFYPEGKHLKTDVFHFTTTIPFKVDDGRKLLEEKYNVSGEFFYCPNQFWIHKNHKILFEAIKILKDRGREVSVYCSGGTKDYRHPEYFDDICRIIKDYSLGNNIHILGLIDREDQLAFLQEAYAIIQPSLYEGWSSSVEEAKSLDKLMILSDLPVLKEQVSRNGFFFSRDDASDLARVIETVVETRPKAQHINYEENIRQAAREFIRIIQGTDTRNQIS